MKAYGLIGEKLSHSFSAQYFFEKFRKENILDSSYSNFELSNLNEITSLLKSNPDLRGLNVTIPYKEEIIKHCDKLSDFASEIGAVNVIEILKVNKSTKLIGHNTDHIGFSKSLESYESRIIRALVLGNGGAAKAVKFALSKMKIGFSVVTRKDDNKLNYTDIDKSVINNHNLIINTTPAGMHPNMHNKPNLPYELLSSKHILYDLIYNPKKTKFLEYGELRGAQVLNGLKMLEVQAEESWKIWNHSI